MYSTALLLATCVILGSDAMKDLTQFKKIGKPQPTISNSIVNLGKIDIAFFLSPPNKELSPRPTFMTPTFQNAEWYPLPKNYPQQMTEEPCPCSSIQHLSKNGPLPNIPELLNKILMNNDLFSYREPASSFACCESHEMRDENSIVFDIEHPSVAKKSPFHQSKQIDILFFPKKKELGTSFIETILLGNNINKMDKKWKADKAEEQQIKNELKNLKFLQFHPMNKKQDTDNTLETNADENKIIDVDTTTILDNDIKNKAETTTTI